MCDSENQDFRGIYTSNGQIMTYTRPSESLGPITAMPYIVRISSLSDCVTFKSEDFFASLHTVSAVSSAATATGSASDSSGSAAATGAAGSKGSNGSAASASRTGSASNATATGKSTHAGAAASVVATGAAPASALATIIGTMFAVAFFSQTPAVTQRSGRTVALQL